MLRTLMRFLQSSQYRENFCLTSAMCGNSKSDFEIPHIFSDKKAVAPCCRFIDVVPNTRLMSAQSEVAGKFSTSSRR